ncbi:DNA-3-methyladenine glycosylase family protein [Candidatus Soleaferrea massiliensis]|uniref:DNA-3-methyladenine glycosylase family protein n=1 Tax=Candidatus Soleaferrea massiliensis TaxID=1470354 RepID=UPI00058FA72D|nr:DNA-3-methyladenine glycosylase [Candidatus Soleaferrea massiliensis]
MQQKNHSLTCGPVEAAYLAQRDPELGKAIERIGPVRREMSPNIFSSLINSIAGQQISGKALETIWGRMLKLLGEPTPQAVCAHTAEELQRCGISHRKAGYILNAAQAVVSGQLDLDRIDEMEDGEACRYLSSLHGVGIWTAEMLLIFSLGRPDVLSFHDLGIRKGIMLLHGLDSLDKKAFQTYRERYSPYGTVASLYLWEIASGR